MRYPVATEVSRKVSREVSHEVSQSVPPYPEIVEKHPRSPVGTKQGLPR